MTPCELARFCLCPHYQGMAKTVAERAREYRDRLKHDPAKLAAWRNRAAARMRKSRGERDVALRVAPQVALREDPVAPQPVALREPDVAPQSVAQHSDSVAQRPISREDFDSLYEERAAIREYEGGQTREEAEAAALRELLKHWRVQ